MRLPSQIGRHLSTHACWLGVRRDAWAFARRFYCVILLRSANSHAGVWRNGSASDSRSEGWELESLCPHIMTSLPGPLSAARMHYYSSLWWLICGEARRAIAHPTHSGAELPRAPGSSTGHMVFVCSCRAAVVPRRCSLVPPTPRCLFSLAGRAPAQ